MPIPAPYEAAFTYLDTNKDAALPGVPQPERAAAIFAMKQVVVQLYDRKPEDLRAAVTMAVDAAKALVAIGIAFFVAVGGFMVQYVMTHDSIWAFAFYLLLAAGLLAVVSMIAGFVAIGRAFRNAQGLSPAGMTTQMWSTKPLTGPLDLQSYAGLAGLACFGVALAFWVTPPSGGLAATQVAPTSVAPSAGYKVRIEGSWTNLMVRRGGLTFTAPSSTTPGQNMAFDVELR
jgi:hypothetical protein